jgi:acid phosphatase
MAVLCLAAAAAPAGCSSNGTQHAADRVRRETAALSGVPNSKHVWMITEENSSYENVIGNSAMPYFNQLASQYGLATQYYSDQHSSLPALMWLVAGAPVETNNDTTSCQHSNDNIVRELLNNGYNWRSYQEDMPYAGYQGLYGGTNNDYYRRHNPLIDFTDVCPGTGQDTNSVPYTQLATDFANGFDTNYAYITPDAVDDLHSGTAQAADVWLANHVPAILGRPEFQPGGDGILFVTFDEGNLSNDNRCSATVSQGCGGRVATLVIGPTVTPGLQSTTTYHHENLLKTVCVALGLSTCPGAAQNAAPMADFFAPPSTSGVTISSPGNGATLFNPVHVVASASESIPISQMQVWDNGSKLGWYPGSTVDQTYTLAVGTHTTTVEDLDSNYAVIHKSEVSYTVQNPTIGVTITSPTSGASLSSPVHIVASAFENVNINQLQVWDNGNKLGWFAGSSVNQYFTLSVGSHTTTVEDLDDSYNVIHKSQVTYSVCAAPVISDPTQGQTVGPAINIQASAPSCIVAMDAYLDGNPNAVATTSSNSFPNPTWVPVSTGSHTLSVNGWDASGNVYLSQQISFTR